MKQYLDIARQILEKGRYVAAENARTQSGYRSIFGTQMHFNLLEGFPIVTAKQTAFRLVVEELLFFLRGDTNNTLLQNRNVSIWDAWAHPVTGELGPIYGAQWREWQGVTPDGSILIIDQLQNVLDELRRSPTTRRAVVSAWNPAVLPDTTASHRENVEAGLQVLPPCHTLFHLVGTELTKEEQQQWINYQENTGVEEPRVAQYGLCCQLYARSQDWFLGTPFNISSYALLTHLLAELLGWAPLQYVHSAGDCHLYDNQIEQTQEMLKRTPYELPLLKISTKRQPHVFDSLANLTTLQADAVRLDCYLHHGKLNAPVEV